MKNPLNGLIPGGAFQTRILDFAPLITQTIPSMGIHRTRTMGEDKSSTQVMLRRGRK
jgi:hypothetical protein